MSFNGPPPAVTWPEVALYLGLAIVAVIFVWIVNDCPWPAKRRR